MSFSKNAGLLKSRVNDFKEHGMYIFDKNKMACKLCEKRVDFSRKSTIDNHIAAKSHEKARERFESNEEKKRQCSISESLTNAKKQKVDKEEFIKSTVRAFARANIPLHKLDNAALREWMNKYVPGKLTNSHPHTVISVFINVSFAYHHSP